MIEKRNLLTGGRETKIADVTASLVKNFAGRIFEAELSVHPACNCEIAAVRVPVGIADVVQQFASGTPAKRDAGEPAHRHPNWIESVLG